MKAFMSRPPLTHYYSTRRSPLPVPHSGTLVENAGPSRRFPHHQIYPRDTGTHRGLAPERRQWSASNHKFWIYESPSPGSSLDGKSSSSSGSGGSKSARSLSETQEESRVRTVSPYGAFFAEEMESETPTENNVRHRQEHGNDSASGMFLPNRKKVPSRNWAISQAQMAPAFFTTGYPVPVPVPVPAAQPDHHHDANATSNNMTGIPFSALSLAENSRRSQPPLSWRQGHPDHPNHPQWGGYSQYDPPPTTTALPRDTRQTDARDGARFQR